MKKDRGSLVIVLLVIIEMICIYSGMTKSIIFLQKEYTFGFANPAIVPLWLLIGALIPAIMGALVLFEVFEEKTKLIKNLAIVLGFGVVMAALFNIFLYNV